MSTLPPFTMKIFARSLILLGLAGVLSLQAFLPPLAEARLWDDRRAAAQWEASSSAPSFLEASPLVQKGVADMASTLPFSGAWADVLAAAGTAALVRPAGEPSLSGPRVLLLQDAHDSPEAQRNMALVLSRLQASGRLGTVGVEGAAGPFDLTLKDDHPNDEVSRVIYEGLMEDGFIGGAELAALTAPGPMSLWGVESPGLFRDNWSAARESARLAPVLSGWAAEAEEALAARKKSIFSPALLSLDAASLRRDRGDLSLSDWAAALAAAAPPGPDMPHARLYLRLLADEKNIDFKAAEAARGRLSRALESSVPAGELKYLIARGQACREGRLSLAAWLEDVSATARRYGAADDSLSAWRRYAVYAAAAESLDRDALWRELPLWEEKAFRVLSISPSQREWSSLSRRFRLFDKFRRLSLPPDEWSRLGDPAAFAADLSRALGGRPGLPAFPAEASAACASFYNHAVARNGAMVDSLLKAAGSSDKVSVLVAGGFHTEGLLPLLKSRGVSCAVATPRFIPVEGEGPLALFAAAPGPLEKLLADRAVHLNKPRRLNDLGRGPPADTLQTIVAGAQNMRKGEGLYQAGDVQARVMPGDVSASPGDLHHRVYAVAGKTWTVVWRAGYRARDIFAPLLDAGRDLAGRARSLFHRFRLLPRLGAALGWGIMALAIVRCELPTDVSTFSEKRVATYSDAEAPLDVYEVVEEFSRDAKYGSKEVHVKFPFKRTLVVRDRQDTLRQARFDLFIDYGVDPRGVVLLPGAAGISLLRRIPEGMDTVGFPDGLKDTLNALNLTREHLASEFIVLEPGSTEPLYRSDRDVRFPREVIFMEVPVLEGDSLRFRVREVIPSPMTPGKVMLHPLEEKKISVPPPPGVSRAAAEGVVLLLTAAMLLSLMGQALSGFLARRRAERAAPRGEALEKAMKDLMEVVDETRFEFILSPSLKRLLLSTLDLLGEDLPRGRMEEILGPDWDDAFEETADLSSFSEDTLFPQAPDALWSAAADLLAFLRPSEAASLLEEVVAAASPVPEARRQFEEEMSAAMAFYAVRRVLRVPSDMMRAAPWIGGIPERFRPVLPDFMTDALRHGDPRLPALLTLLSFPDVWSAVVGDSPGGGSRPGLSDVLRALPSTREGILLAEKWEEDSPGALGFLTAFPGLFHVSDPRLGYREAEAFQNILPALLNFLQGLRLPISKAEHPESVDQLTWGLYQLCRQNPENFWSRLGVGEAYKARYPRDADFWLDSRSWLDILKELRGPWPGLWRAFRGHWLLGAFLIVAAGMPFQKWGVSEPALVAMVMPFLFPWRNGDLEIVLEEFDRPEALKEALLKRKSDLIRAGAPSRGTFIIRRDSLNGISSKDGSPLFLTTKDTAGTIINELDEVRRSFRKGGKMFWPALLLAGAGVLAAAKIFFPGSGPALAGGLLMAGVLLPIFGLRPGFVFSYGERLKKDYVILAASDRGKGGISVHESKKTPGKDYLVYSHGLSGDPFEPLAHLLLHPEKEKGVRATIHRSSNGKLSKVFGGPPHPEFNAAFIVSEQWLSPIERKNKGVITDRVYHLYVVDEKGRYGHVILSHNLPEKIFFFDEETPGTIEILSGQGANLKVLMERQPQGFRSLGEIQKTEFPLFGFLLAAAGLGAWFADPVLGAAVTASGGFLGFPGPGDRRVEPVHPSTPPSRDPQGDRDPGSPKKRREKKDAPASSVRISLEARLLNPATRREAFDALFSLTDKKRALVVAELFRVMQNGDDEARQVLNEYNARLNGGAADILRPWSRRFLSRVRDWNAFPRRLAMAGYYLGVGAWEEALFREGMFSLFGVTLEALGQGWAAWAGLAAANLFFVLSHAVSRYVYRGREEGWRLERLLYELSREFREFRYHWYLSFLFSAAAISPVGWLGAALLHAVADHPAVRGLWSRLRPRDRWGFVNEIQSMMRVWDQQLLDRSITFFGSARFSRDSHFYKLTERLAARCVEEGWDVTSGAGPSIMEAANRGAWSVDHRRTHGSKIELKIGHELEKNPFILEGNVSSHRYFGLRKAVIVGNGMRVAVCMPGGYGTIDEFLENLAQGVPMVLYGKAVWDPIWGEIQAALRDYGIEDTPPIFITDNEEEAFSFIQKMMAGHVPSSRPSVPVVEETFARIEREARLFLPHVEAWQDAVVLIGGDDTPQGPVRRTARFLMSHGRTVRAGGKDVLGKLNGLKHHPLLQSVRHIPPSELHEARENTASLGDFNPFRKKGSLRHLVASDGPLHRYLLGARSRGYVFLPGKVSRLHILFDLMTQMQTQMLPRAPIVLVGKKYWASQMRAIPETLLKLEHLEPYKKAMISPADAHRFVIVETLDEVPGALGWEAFPSLPALPPSTAHALRNGSGLPGFAWQDQSEEDPKTAVKSVDEYVFRRLTGLADLARSLRWIRGPNGEDLKARLWNEAVLSDRLADHLDRVMEDLSGREPALSPAAQAVWRWTDEARGLNAQDPGQVHLKFDRMTRAVDLAESLAQELRRQAAARLPEDGSVSEMLNRLTGPTLYRLSRETLIPAYRESGDGPAAVSLWMGGDVVSVATPESVLEEALSGERGESLAEALSLPGAEDARALADSALGRFLKPLRSLPGLKDPVMAFGRAARVGFSAGLLTGLLSRARALPPDVTPRLFAAVLAQVRTTVPGSAALARLKGLVAGHEAGWMIGARSDAFLVEEGRWFTANPGEPAPPVVVHVPGRSQPQGRAEALRALGRALRLSAGRAPVLAVHEDIVPDQRELNSFGWGGLAPATLRVLSWAGAGEVRAGERAPLSFGMALGVMARKNSYTFKEGEKVCLLSPALQDWWVDPRLRARVSLFQLVGALALRVMSWDLHMYRETSQKSAQSA